MANQDDGNERALLRRRAEKALAETAGVIDDLSGKSSVDLAASIHELRVHQIELKMQNEELRRIQEELETMRDRYAHLYDFSPVGYLSVSEEGIITEANLTIASMFHVNRGDLIEKHLFKYIHSEDQDIYFQHRRHLLETEDPQVCELRFVKPNGEQFYARLDCMIIENKLENSREIRAAVSDITESKQAKKERDSLQEKLQQAQKMESIGTLAGGIAHEFNNILAIIMGNNELVMEELPQRSLAKESTEEIQIACSRARDVVKQLLLFSRQTDQQYTYIQTAAVVRDSLKLIRSSTPVNIEINLNITDDIAPVWGNATQINQLLINLCGNATDAMFNTGGAITIDLSNVTIDEEESKSHASLYPGHYVKILIRDTGHGMDRWTLNRIFEPYFTPKELGKGTGIGLAVVHGIVEKSKGTIFAESSPDKGTVFTILFPAYEGDVLPDVKAMTAMPTGDERILYVDDEPLVVKLGQRRLESLGYTVQGFTDSSEAWVKFTNDPSGFDLVITDMAMPQMTGEQLAAEILNIRPDMPVVLCTGYSDRITEEQALEMGIYSYIMKPMTKSELAVLIRKILDETKKS